MTFDEYIEIFRKESILVEHIEGGYQVLDMKMPYDDYKDHMEHFAYSVYIDYTQNGTPLEQMTAFLTIYFMDAIFEDYGYQGGKFYSMYLSEYTLFAEDLMKAGKDA